MEEYVDVEGWLEQRNRERRLEHLLREQIKLLQQIRDRLGPEPTFELVTSATISRAK